MRVAETIGTLGIAADAGEEIVLASINGTGRVEHWRLTEIADRDATDYAALYLASGAFLQGTVSRTRGRTSDNVTRLFWLPFDCDLADYLGFSRDAEARKAEVAALHDSDDATLEAMIAAQRADVEAAFAAVGIPLHRLDYTGYGLCAYVRLAEDAANDITAARQLHKALIARLNAALPGVPALVDPQVSDAGTRITRLPGSLNRKSERSRTVRTLTMTPGTADLCLLQASAQQVITRATITPLREHELPRESVGAIVRAVQPHWTLGQKHAMGLAIGGLLAKAGVAEAQALAIVHHLSAEDDKPWDREAAVRRSYERVRSGLDVRGYTALAELMPPEAVAFVDRTLAPLREATTARILVSPARAQREHDLRADAPAPSKFTSVPAIAFHGWFGAYRDLMSPTTEAPDAFHLGASLCLVGAMLGRRAHTHAGNRLFGNLYVVLVGPTGQSRKDTAMSRAISLPRFAPPDPPAKPRAIAAPDFWLMHDVTSSEGLVQVLSDRPNLLLYMTEFSMMLRRARRQSTSTLLTMLIKLWDAPDFVDLPTRKEPVEARDTLLSILTATTPDTLAIDMTAEEIASGFANRHLFFAGEGIGPKASPPRVDDLTAARLMSDLRTVLATYQDDEVPKDPEATERFVNWYDRFYRWEHRNDDEASMVQRMPANIHKLALLYAVVDGDRTIRLPHLESAIAVVEWSWQLVKHELDRWGQVEDARIAGRILSVLERRGAMSKRLLQQAIGRKLGPGAFTRVLDAMVRTGDVMIDAAGIVIDVKD